MIGDRYPTYDGPSTTWYSGPSFPYRTQVSGSYDPVNKPEHYAAKDIECIDYIKQQVKDYPSFLEGNVIKYITRWKDKNGVEDLRKARWYLDKLILSEVGETDK